MFATMIADLLKSVAVWYANSQVCKILCVECLNAALYQNAANYLRDNLRHNQLCRQNAHGKLDPAQPFAYRFIRTHCYVFSSLVGMLVLYVLWYFDVLVFCFENFLCQSVLFFSQLSIWLTACWCLLAGNWQLVTDDCSRLLAVI